MYIFGNYIQLTSFFFERFKVRKTLGSLAKCGRDKHEDIKPHCKIMFIPCVNLISTYTWVSSYEANEKGISALTCSSLEMTPK